MERFVITKLNDLEEYDVIKDKVDYYKVLLDNKEMELYSPSCFYVIQMKASSRSTRKIIVCP